MKPWGLMAGVLTLAAGSALAHPYPSRPVRMIIPAGTGGGVDTVGRLVGAQLTSALGQPVVMDNRPGAGGAHHKRLQRHCNVKSRNGRKSPLASSSSYNNTIKLKYLILLNIL